MDTLYDGGSPTLHFNNTVNNKNHQKANNASSLVTIPPIQNSVAHPPYQLRVLGIANQGAKSRVETQIRLELQLIDDTGKRPHQWSHIRLSTALLTQKRRSATTSSLTTITPNSPPSSRQKSIALKLDQPDPQQQQPLSIPEESILYLDASVICDSDIHRKWKRADRKKNRRKLDNDIAGDEVLMEKERQRILLFNSDPVLTYDQGICVLPTRITCYSRHHDERQGFRIKFTIHDYQGHLVAAGSSATIMITDDHKNLSKLGGKCRRRKTIKKATKSPSPAYLPTPEQETSPTFDESNFSLVTQSIRVHDISSTSGTADIGSLDLNNTTTTGNLKNGASNLMDSSYLFDPTIFIPSSPSSLWSGMSSTTDRGSTISSSPPPLPALAMIYSPCQQQHQQPVTFERMIPNQASVEGGTEITLLGSNFYEGMTWIFGDQPALMTTYWSPTTLVCTVPPVIHPGPVLVRCLDLTLWPTPLPLVFTYTPSLLPSPSPSLSPLASPSTQIWNNTVSASSSTWQQLLHFNNDHDALGLSPF